MEAIFKKTFGGLSAQYYFRQFIFGLAMSAFVIYMRMHGKSGGLPGLNMWLMVVVSTLLYPYSRFVYESITSFILGKNVFWVNGVMLIFIKFMTMVLCWGFAIFIAPVGLAYLYYHHSKLQEPQGD
ncbi:MAG: hypothetical protein WBA20_13390 [Ketobacter sp.]